jgi:hypothetical protein
MDELNRANRAIIEKEIILFVDALALLAAVIKRKDAIIADYRKREAADPDKTDAEHMEDAIRNSLEKLAGLAFDNLKTKEA